MDIKELLKLSPAELVDLGICPTCLNRKHNKAIYGDDSKTLIYEDNDIECLVNLIIFSLRLSGASLKSW